MEPGHDVPQEEGSATVYEVGSCLQATARDEAAAEQRASAVLHAQLPAKLCIEAWHAGASA
jgi:hypothetical protein